MRIKLKKELKIGILMVLTISIFIWGYSFLKGKNLLKPTSSYYALYDGVGGLMESGHVMLGGYKIGYVDNIRFMDDLHYLVVRISIDKNFKLPEGTVARIYSSDVMGTRAVELVPGISGEFHFPGDTLIGVKEPDLREEISLQILPLKLRAEDMMASMDSVLLIIQSLLDKDFQENFAGSISNINSTINSLHRSVYSVDTLLTMENSRFNRILANIESISGSLEESNEDIGTILSNFANLSDSLAKSEIIAVINNLNEILQDASQLIGSVSEGEGSIGRLMRDEELYNNLESATRSLDLLLTDLRDRPGRYLNFSVFGRRQD